MISKLAHSLGSCATVTENAKKHKSILIRLISVSYAYGFQNLRFFREIFWQKCIAGSDFIVNFEHDRLKSLTSVKAEPD